MTPRFFFAPILSMLLALLVCGAGAAVAHGTATSEQNLATAKYDQRIGAALPAVIFRDLQGGSQDLAGLNEDRPLVLVLSWFECPDLCPMVLDQVARAAEQLPFESNRYRVAVVSIDPAEGAAEGRVLRRQLQRRHGDAVAGWHFLHGEPDAIGGLAEAVGFRYAYDAEADRYAHPSGVVVIAPGGRISHYLLQLDPDSPDLRLALLEAGEGELGSPVQQALLRCYRFDPDSGRYNLAVGRLLQVAGGVSLLALGGLVVWLRRREDS